MKIYIYATEALYGGYHGIEDMTVIEVEDGASNTEDIINDIGYQLSHELIESYGLEQDYMDHAGIEDIEEFYENYNEITCDCDWSAFKIKDDITLSTRELENECFKLGDSIFRKEYCEGESLI